MWNVVERIFGSGRRKGRGSSGTGGPSSRHGLVGRVDLAKMKREFQIEFLKSVGLAPSNTLLDYGCGTLRGGIPMIDYLDAGNYCGVEVRPAVLAEAWRELKEAGLQDEKPLLLGSAEAVIETGRLFDVIWMFSVAIHMDDAHLLAAFKMVGQLLAPGGRAYANVNIGPERVGSTWQGFPVMWRPLTVFEECAGAAGLDVGVVGSLWRLGHRSGVADQDQQVMLVFSRNAAGRVDEPRAKAA